MKGLAASAGDEFIHLDRATYPGTDPGLNQTGVVQIVRTQSNVRLPHGGTGGLGDSDQGAASKRTVRLGVVHRHPLNIKVGLPLTDVALGARQHILAPQAQDIELIKVVLGAALVPLNQPKISPFGGTGRPLNGNRFLKWLARNHHPRAVAAHVFGNVHEPLRQGEYPPKSGRLNSRRLEFWLALESAQDLIRRYRSVDAFG